MKKISTTQWKVAAIAAAATALLAASTAGAETKTYIACNQWNECWKVKEHVTAYPADVHVVYRDSAWWDQHQHDAQWRELPDPTTDNGWYDQAGAWHDFETTAPPH
jgi:hypothetical protein